MLGEHGLPGDGGRAVRPLAAQAHISVSSPEVRSWAATACVHAPASPGKVDGEQPGLWLQSWGSDQESSARADPEQLLRLDPSCRLQVMTNGWETVDMTLRRNGLGQLGFHVKYDGTVAEVEDYGFAWQAGLRQGSRLVEICKVAVVTLTHDQMIDLLRTSVTVKVVIIPPFDDGTPRR